MMSNTLETQEPMQAGKDGTFRDDTEDTLKNMFLSFCLGSEDYCLEIRHVTEIVGMQKVTEVPDMPHYVKGVVNLRG